MSKSKIILLAFIPFVLLNSAFSAEVRDAKTDTRRMLPLYRINRDAPNTPQAPAPQGQVGKVNSADKANKAGSVRAK